MAKEGWKEFLELCTKTKNAKRLEELLELFLTHEEKETLGQRFLIIKALEEKADTQREIAEKLHASISQITRGSNALKIISQDLKKFLKSEIQNRQRQKKHRD